MSAQNIADAFAPAEANYKSIVMADTWGHLAPKRNRKYKGKIVYAVGCFGSDNLNPTPISCEFKGLDSSPWFYNSLMDMLRNHANEEGCVYEWLGYFRNYNWVGIKRLVFSSNINP